MEPFEIMVSESQERMLCVVRARPRRRGARASARSGRSTAPRSATSPTRGRMRVLRGGEVVGDMPVAALVDDCPLYDLEPAAPDARRSTRRPTRRSPPGAAARDAAGAARARRTSPRAARCSSSTTAIVQSRTVRRPERGRRRRARAARRRRAIARRRSTATAAASPPTPTRGAIEAVLECAANLACVGAEPLGLTNCLNFGNPEKPHIAWQLTEAVRGLGDACRALDVAGRRRQRLALQRGRRRPDLPDAGRRHGRRAARRRARRRGSASRARATRSRSSAGLRRRRSRRSELAKLRGEALPDGLPADRHRRRARARTRRSATRSAAARCRSCHDIAEGGLAVARRRVLPRRRHRRDARLGRRRPTRRCCSARRRAGFVVSGDAAALDALGERIPLDVVRRRSAATTRSTTGGPSAGRWPSCARPTARSRRCFPSRRRTLTHPPSGGMTSRPRCAARA